MNPLPLGPFLLFPLILLSFCPDPPPSLKFEEYHVASLEKDLISSSTPENLDSRFLRLLIGSTI